MFEKLITYFEISNSHIEALQRALKYVKPFYPFDENFKEELANDTLFFALDSLVFRFAKLQDHLGQKIFRNFLEFENYPTGESFLRT